MLKTCTLSINRYKDTGSIVDKRLNGNGVTNVFEGLRTFPSKITQIRNCTVTAANKSKIKELIWRIAKKLYASPATFIGLQLRHLLNYCRYCGKLGKPTIRNFKFSPLIYT